MYYDEFFVLITKKYFGVFALDADFYPEEFKKNISNVCIKNRMEIDMYLLKHPDVGRNTLNKYNFNMCTSVGKLYYL